MPTTGKFGNEVKDKSTFRHRSSTGASTVEPITTAFVVPDCACSAKRTSPLPPGARSHWGQLVCGWPRSRRVRTGEAVRLLVRRFDAELTVVLAD